eukprot:12979614-Alexandrium_andersonii.AAC.1
MCFALSHFTRKKRGATPTIWTARSHCARSPKSDRRRTTHSDRLLQGEIQQTIVQGDEAFLGEVATLPRTPALPGVGYRPRPHQATPMHAQGGTR